MEDKLTVLPDQSEILHYEDPGFPLYCRRNRLDMYPFKQVMCHWHSEFEFFLVEEGHPSYFINGTIVALKPGDVLFINAKYPHYGFSSDGSDSTYLVLVFPPSLLEPSPSLGPAFVDPLLLDPSVPFLLFESEAAASLYQKALAIFQIMQSHENGYPLLALSGLYAFYQDFLQRKGQEKAVALTRSPQALLLKKMLTFIYSHYQEPIEGDDIALAADLSSGYAIHLFSQLLRTSPMVYLRSYRLQKAAELLRDPTFNIEEIAAAVGFLSPSYFAASFHKEKGMSPREYRKLFISSSSQKE